MFEIEVYVVAFLLTSISSCLPGNGQPKNDEYVPRNFKNISWFSISSKPFGRKYHERNAKGKFYTLF